MTFYRTEDTFNVRPFMNIEKFTKLCGGVEYDQCILCFKRIKDDHAGYAVHAVNGDLWALARIDATDVHDAGDMGWWLVGPECAKNIPSAYKRKNR